MSRESPPRVPMLDRVGGAIAAHAPRLLRRIAAWESAALREELDRVRIERPVYVCGLARAGSTLLLELLADVPGFTAHRYADYPFLWTPYWWNWLRQRLPLPATAAAERAHGDGIAVTRESPEALEEIFWMHFFPGRHDPAVDQVLDDAPSETFAKFYLDHVRKLLAVRGATRYLAKGNYNLSRAGLLLSLLPDARFVVALREPSAHIASLLRQDRRFTQWARAEPAIALHMARCGHFEFGPHKRAINFGDPAQALEIQACFDSGRTIEGYARQWAAAYGWLAARWRADAQFARACLIVSHERLCAEPAATLAALYAHAGVDAAAAERLVARHAPRIGVAPYYAAEFTPEEGEIIRRQTEGVWQFMHEIL